MFPSPNPRNERLPPVGKRVRDLSGYAQGVEPAAPVTTPHDAAKGLLIEGKEPEARLSRAQVNARHLRWCLTCDRRLPDTGRTAFCQGHDRRTKGYCRRQYDNELQNIRRMLKNPEQPVGKDLLRDLHRSAERTASSRTALLVALRNKQDFQPQLNRLLGDVAALTTRIHNDLPDPPKRAGS